MNLPMTLLAALALQGTPSLTPLSIEGQATDATGDLRYYRVAAGDLDGDGRADKAILKVRCADGIAVEAAMTPRDSASGLPTGKRQHKPVVLVKQWGAASPALIGARVGYDVKKVEGTGARAGYDVKKVEGTGVRSWEDDWTPVTLNNSAPLCSLATAKP